MRSFSKDELDALARTGSLMEKVTVASRTNVKPETLAYLMETEPDDEIKLTIMSRQDVTAEQLRWAAGSESAFVLNRLVSMDRTPLDVVHEIRERAVARRENDPAEVWEHLASYADRVLARRESGELNL